MDPAMGWLPFIGRKSFLFVILVLGCQPDCTPPPGPVRPDVVLVTVDTLRADHLGCYGNPTVLTPSLDALARDGVLFERCYAQSHITLPSHLTILSSLPLADHGVLTNEDTANAAIEVLPRLFARAGYRAAAFVSARHLGPRGGLGPVMTDLEVHEAPSRGSQPFAASDTNRRLFRWLRGACRDPVFVWVHYFDPHMPYTPPPPFDRAYYQGDPFDPHETSMEGVVLNWYFHDLDGIRPRLASRPDLVRPLKRELGVNSRTIRELVLHPDRLAAHLDGNQVDPQLRSRLQELATVARRGLPYRRHLADWLTGVRDLRFPLAQYAGEVSYVDQEIGRLRSELEHLGLAERTILVLTADHGEGLGEHGIYFNHYGLHEPMLRVPLIVWAPGRVVPARRPQLARGLDVAPTVLRLAGLSVPASMQGRDLFGPVGDDEPFVAEAIRAEQLMVLEGRWKLIRTLRSFHYVDAFARAAGATELYDLTEDPGELVNVVERYPDVARALSTRLDAWLRAHPIRTPAGAPPSERLRSLRALGYVV